ncbi:CDP-diacylglycerol--serine O-phosphatidyltransferase [Formosa algae]|uniref:CDP-diacylglycerol--serine O-phosphatidyltransferase n=1 Tax=Formosa algae TaxID=225843 RepID=A0A9X0YMM2_9FLAO|nr:CDP-alcohol phosphatidyltransferase family protein [Formosa algae]MBP1839766.1 CDP-diacylglycerol--serine O-phosphatidyltransferase [Formosa algae]MDQ0335365.1 CDP-diacylglycerol--serine O-phosphatidyltransferase [Formosa algae]
MSIKNYVPNALTLLNLFCGCIAVIFATHNHFIAAAAFVFGGVFFDFFDGFAARKLKVSSELGLQLDSLADMVTSGVVPGIVMFKLLGLSIGRSELAVDDGSWNAFFSGDAIMPSFLPVIGFFITLSSAYRLAKFNLDEEQQDYFKGLPTPANTLLIISLPLIMELQHNDIMNAIIMNQGFLIALTITSSFLLNAPIILFALKFKTWDFKPNAIRYIFLIISVLLLVFLQFAAIPLIILVYVAMSMLDIVIKGEY